MSLPDKVDSDLLYEAVATIIFVLSPVIDLDEAVVFIEEYRRRLPRFGYEYGKDFMITQEAMCNTALIGVRSAKNYDPLDWRTL